MHCNIRKPKCIKTTAGSTDKETHFTSMSTTVIDYNFRGQRVLNKCTIMCYTMLIVHHSQAQVLFGQLCIKLSVPPIFTTCG